MEIIGLFSNPSVNPRFERFLQIADGFQAEESRPPSTPPRSYQHQRRLSTQERTQLLEAYRAGIPIKEIATAYGIHRQTVFAHAKRAGLRRRKPALSSADVDTAIRLYAEGKSLLTIGKELGVANSTVQRALVGAGVRIRERR